MMFVDDGGDCVGWKWLTSGVDVEICNNNEEEK
jgi:hypothetical protein